MLASCCHYLCVLRLSILDIDWFVNGHASDVSVLSLWLVALTILSGLDKNEHKYIIATMLLLLWHYHLQHQLYSRLVQIRQRNVFVVRTFLLLPVGKGGDDCKQACEPWHLRLGTDRRGEWQFASIFFCYIGCLPGSTGTSCKWSSQKMLSH